MKNLTLKLLFLLSLFLLQVKTYAQNPNFHIYICFGQSNMEGQGVVEPEDTTVDERFQVFQSLNCENLQAKKANWRTAVPPLCHCHSGLSPVDYFGRTLIENLPDSIKIGVINVAIGGCDIRLFDKDIYKEYKETYKEDWFIDKIKAYGGNPYKHIIKLAKKAQKEGVIKGILLHQGETNTGDGNWPNYVKTVYNNMLSDLSLKAENVPLLAGEVVQVEPNCCASMNKIIGTLSEVIPTAYVISSKDCSKKDNAHFDAAGYRLLGTRYGEKMLELLNK